MPAGPRARYTLSLTQYPMNAPRKDTPMTVTSVVRPLPGPGLVARSGDLMLVCSEGTDATRAEVEQLLGLVPEVASTGGDGAVLVRRVAALLAADLDGLFPDCAACGPIADGRLAVLVWGTATARIVGGDGVVTLTATDAVTSVNRLVPGPITSIRLELPGAGPASRFARLDAGVVSAAGFVAGEDAPGGAATVFPVPVPAAPAETTAPAQATAPAPAAAPAVPTDTARPAPVTPTEPPHAAEPVIPTQPAESAIREPSPAPAWTAPTAEPPVVPEPVVPEPAVSAPEPAVPEPAVSVPEPAPVPEPVAVAETAPPADPAPVWTPPTETPSWAVSSVADTPAVPAQATPATEAPWSPPQASPAESPALPVREPLAEPAGPDPRPTVLGLACPLGHLNDPSLTVCAVCGSPLPTQPPTLREGPRPPLGVLTLDDGSQHLLDTGYVLGREPQHDPEVVAGGARALKIVDTEGVVSRRHLRVALVGWDIQIIDLGSANGTYVQHPDDTQLHKLEPHHAVVVKVGTQVTMGRRSFRIDPVPADQRG